MARYNGRAFINILPALNKSLNTLPIFVELLTDNPYLSSHGLKPFFKIL